MKVLVLNYTHPEGYPPTFNAINNLSKHFEKVIVLSKNNLPTVWNYDSNVNLILQDEIQNRFKSELKSKFSKFKSYLNYVVTFRKLIIKEKPELLILYDALPLFFYYLIKPTIRQSNQPKVWYHNHDINPLSFYKKYSTNWFGAVIEQKKINIASYFSLPAIEREKYFPLASFSGKYYFIPNYPSKYFHGELNNKQKIINDKINIVYPGNISEKHGFEELIPILKEKVHKKELHLTLVGDIRQEYKKYLTEIAKNSGTLHHLHFHDRVSYFKVPEMMSTQHIGWAVNKPLNITYTTGGTAANKIYEYLALGMPIILYDNLHYREHLDGNNWALFSDLSKESLLKNIESIDQNFDKMSLESRKSFESHFTFESAFESTIHSIKKDILNEI